MATKSVVVDGIGEVTLTKRRGAKSIRLSIAHDGTVRVSLPSWVPYSAGVAFVHTKSDWIRDQLPQKTVLIQNQRVGKAHHIHFEPGSGSSVSTRLTGNQIRVLLPIGTTWSSQAAQDAANQAAIRALKKEAKQLLPYRLQTLAKQYGYEYRSVAIKQLSGRWGSCSDQKDIVFNCYLIQLPWELIDYVILHELAHTRVMAHGPVFWAEMKQHLPNLAVLRRQIKSHKPVL